MKLEIEITRDKLTVDTVIGSNTWNGVERAEEQDLLQVGAVVAALGFSPGWTSRIGHEWGHVTYTFYRG